MPRKSWWARLPFGVRMVAGTSALLILGGGAVVGVVALSRGSANPAAVTVAGPDSGAAPAGSDAAAPDVLTDPAPVTAQHPAAAKELTRTAEEADRTVPRNPRRPAGVPAAPRATSPGARPAAPRSARPVVTTRTDVETREIPFKTRVVRDPALARGTKRVQSAGVPGQETLRYLVTLADGQPTGRRLIDTTVTRRPQHRVVVLGTRPPAPQPAQCGQSLDICVPLGRAALCPSFAPGDDRRRAVADPAADLGGASVGGDASVDRGASAGGLGVASGQVLGTPADDGDPLDSDPLAGLDNLTC